MARGGPPPACKPERCPGDCKSHWASHHHQHCRPMPQPDVQQPSHLPNQEHQHGLIVCTIAIAIMIQVIMFQQPAAEDKTAQDLFDKDDKVYDNRILCCLVISPAGQPVMSGVLIDLDLAKECTRHGWMKLKKLQLESHEGQTLPKDSMLKEWYTGTYKKIARIKRSDMSVDRFDDILSEFPPWFECVKPLCNAVQDILFPYGKKGLIVGTPQDPKRLYDPIIKAYEDAIALLEAGEI
ncbi:hypothetical protein CIHG_07488 [Coccidioides immitis H538.4]|uniref:Uncharacterized protein n=1 Tax=Coccidioides immitis H538.4 TaxID=396776 RepID=A0A0J8RYM5_COCIT|nr:hypothetical protein CIHG_07488 [Coccidioides immitis H538.4]